MERDVVTEDRIDSRNWGLLALLMAAMVFSQVDRLVLSVLLEPIKRDLAVTDTQLGLLNGIAFGIFYAVMGLPLGWLADRWSRKGTIILGIAVWSFATATCGLAQRYHQLLLSRIFVGAGEAGLSPAAYSMLHDRFPRERLSTVISLLQVGSMLGGGLALVLVGAVYSLALDMSISGPLATFKPWQITFILVALPGPIFLALFALVREDGHRLPGSAPPKAEKLSLAVAFKAHNKTYICLMLGMGGLVLAMYSLISWVPAMMAREFGWSATKIASIFGLIALIAGPLGLILGGWACDRLTARGVAAAHGLVGVASAGLSLPCFLAMSVCDNPPSLLIVIALAEFFVVMPLGTAPALTQILTPAGSRGQMSALYVMSVNLIGIGIGPVLAGAASEALFTGPAGLRHAVSLTSSAFLAVSLLLLWQLCRALQPPAGREERAVPVHR